MFEARKCEVERIKSAGGWVVRLRGSLNETLDSEKLVEDLSGTVIFDLGGVGSVTSFGVRQWLSGLRRLQVDYYAFVRCRPCVVAQFNMVSNFGGLGELVSLYAPYVCAECDQVDEHLIDLRTSYAEVTRGDLPELKCSHCGKPSELDDIPDYFFSFVASRPKPFLPALAERLIDGQSGTGGSERLNIQKEVDGLVTALHFSGPLEGTPKIRRLLAGLEGYVIAEMSSLTKLTREGLAHFIDTIKYSDIEELYLVGVDLPILESMPRQVDSLLEVKVASALIEQKCSSCGSTVNVDVMYDENPQSLVHPFALGCCSACGEQIQTVLSEDVGAKLQGILSIPRLEVKLYLQRRRQSSGDSHSSAAFKFELERMAAQKYEKIARIASGGMGEVYLARQRGLEGFEKTVVLKQILPSLAANPKFIDMFLQEAKIAVGISHPNVVQIFDLGRDDVGYFTAMEFVDGWDLRTVVGAIRAQERLMPYDIACRIMSSVCAGLEAAHSATDAEGANLGIVHCDVSPHNILISKQGVAKLTDFGIAKAASSLNSESLKGKIAYMAPEMILGGSVAVTPAADIFAVGLVLYECLTGRGPFLADTEKETMRATVHDDPTSISSVIPEVPEEIDTVLRRAMAKSPMDRHPSCEALRMDLENILVAHGRVTTQAQVALWVDETLRIGEGTTRTETTLDRSTNSESGENLQATLVSKFAARDGEETLERAVAGKKTD